MTLAHLLPLCQHRCVNRSGDLGELRRVALAVAREWPAAKLSMALRAINPEVRDESLESIATEFGVSRETVRRARNELVRRVGAVGSPEVVAILPGVASPTLSDPATARALRRLLTMTGPLTWDEVLTSWARAGGRAPYVPLPTDAESVRLWIADVRGLKVAADDSLLVSAEWPEDLDAVGAFLLETLGGRPRGLDRADLLALAEQSGLKGTTIATTLSSHPAVVRLGRGVWALRGHVGAVDPVDAVARRRVSRPRPTSFSWAPSGALELTFAIPRGPSPVLAVPKAVAALIEGREFEAATEGRPARIAVKNAKLWGFDSLVSSAGLAPGERGVLSLNLIAGSASLTALGWKDGER